MGRGNEVKPIRGETPGEGKQRKGRTKERGTENSVEAQRGRTEGLDGENMNGVEGRRRTRRTRWKEREGKKEGTGRE